MALTNNDRIFHACQAVLYQKVSPSSYVSDPTGASFLTGVQSVGVNVDTPSYSLPDIGRSQRNYLWYEQPNIEITVERVITSENTFFYATAGTLAAESVDNYKNTYFLSSDGNNFGMSGSEMPQYNIVILYGPEGSGYIGKVVDPGDPTPDVIESITYEYCLLTNISYNITVLGSVRETLTFVTKSTRRNTDYLEAADYTNLPTFPETAEAVTWRFFLDKSATGNKDVCIYPEEVIQTFTPTFTGESSPLKGLQTIDLAMNINYSELPDVGNWRGSEAATGTDLKANELNTWKYINMPLEITCSFTGIASQAFRSGQLSTFNRAIKNVDTNFTANYNADTSVRTAVGGQTADCQIRLAAAVQTATTDFNYFVWDLNSRNYLSSIGYSGGDAPSGNLELTLEYANTYNDFVAYKALLGDPSTNPLYAITPQSSDEYY